MKKLILLLGLILAMALTIPQAAFGFAQAPDADVGYKFTLPADHNAVVTVDCQAVVTAPEFVVQVIERDPGDRSMELASATLSGLRAKSPAANCALSNGDLTYNDFRNHNRQCNKLREHYRLKVTTPRIVSTSCGGIGY